MFLYCLNSERLVFADAPCICIIFSIALLTEKLQHPLSVRILYLVRPHAHLESTKRKWHKAGMSGGWATFLNFEVV